MGTIIIKLTEHFVEYMKHLHKSLFTQAKCIKAFEVDCIRISPVFSTLAIFRYVSVVHMNPAATLGLFQSGVFEVRLVAPFILGSGHF